MDEDSEDLRHLRLLSIFYYVAAGLQALVSLFGLIYIALGVAMASGKLGNEEDLREGEAAFVAGVFFFVGGAIVLLCLLGVGLSFFSARGLRGRHSRTLILITAGLACLQVPLGTILGVFTFVVMMRPSVVALFEQEPGDRALT